MKQHHVSSPPHPQDLAAITNTFKALSDPTRAQIILLLVDMERTVGDLIERLSLPQSTVSRHLAILRSSHLVATRRDGNRIYYRLSSNHVGDLVREAFSHAEHERLGMLEHDAEDLTEGVQ